jgi:hypothetical protein
MLDPNREYSTFDKMRIIGKIGNEPTILDIQGSNEPNIELKYGKLKFTGIGRFPSIRANNSVISGKWCYEVQLLSNKLFQIGWVRINLFILIKKF